MKEHEEETEYVKNKKATESAVPMASEGEGANEKMMNDEDKDDEDGDGDDGWLDDVEDGVDEGEEEEKDWVEWE